MRKSRDLFRRLAIGFATIFAVSGLMLASVPAASAAPAATPFQLQTFVFADLPTPIIGASSGFEPGTATLSILNQLPDRPVTAAVSVRWISLGTGISGVAFFPTLAGAPTPPVTIKPGVGQVIATIEGGLYPGFGTFFVP
ncbi:hypothetical protein ACHIPZ_20130 [Antrihabitans sp. NCIMB 15449]